MNWRFAALTLILAAGHYFLLMFLIILMWGAGMAEFEGEAAAIASDSVTYQALDLLGTVLAYPGLALWTPWMSQNMPNVLEAALFLSNSLLWGWVAALVLRRIVTMAVVALRRRREKAIAI